MSTLYKRTQVNTFSFVHEVIKEIQQNPRKERYNVQLSFCTEADLHKALQLSFLLHQIGSGANILINSETMPMVLDFLTSELNDSDYTLYIPDQY